MHPREVYRRAIAYGAASIIVAHNHPSGDCTPSQEDYSVTRQLVNAGDLIGVALVDHIVFSRKGFYSFKDQNFI